MSLVQLGLFIAAILAFVIFTGVIIVRDAVFGLNGLTNEQLRFLAVPLAGLGLLLMILNPARAGRLLVLNVLLICLLLYSFASTLWSIDAQTTSMRSLALVLSTLGAIGLASHFEGLKLVRIVAIAMTVGTGLSFLFWLRGDPMVWDSLAWVGLRGVFSHKNLLGQCCVIAVVLGAALAMQKNILDRVLGLAVVLLGLRMALLAQSATAYVAIAIGLSVLALFVILSRPWLPGFLKPAILLATGVAAMLVAVFRSQIIQLLGREENLTGRDEIWGYVLEQIRDRPMFGYGYRAYFTAPQNVDEIERVLDHAYDQAHSSILQTILDLGFFGLALLAIWIAIAMRRAPQAVFDPAQRAWLALLIALSFNALTEALIMSPTGFTWLTYQICIVALAGPLVERAMAARSTVPPHWQGPAYRMRR
jgi:exopolysaccharide production protein ExoQ